ncbi:hypothetical protein ACGYLI_14105 [Sulfitobacter sp. 1A13421]|uniref:hypothetical protein n=1 Tax=unclassified Sulfitobacter TaxID=196795 RepID=UPI0012E947B9|nr:MULTISPECIES: hypothetical protein [unclassified Sulfitobacter]
MACPTHTDPHQSLFSSAQSLCSIREFRSPEGAGFSNSDVFDPKGQLLSCAKPSQLRAVLGKSIPEGVQKHKCENFRLHLGLRDDGKTILCPTSDATRDQGDCHNMCLPPGDDALCRGSFKALIFRKHFSRDTGFRAEFPAPKSGFQSHHAGAKKSPQAQGQTQTWTEKEDLTMTT